MVCKLCFLKKTTTWYKDTKDYLICDCPVCGEKLIVMKNHNLHSYSAKKQMKDIVKSFLGREGRLYDKECFPKDHPHSHFSPITITTLELFGKEEEEKD